MSGFPIKAERLEQIAAGSQPTAEEARQIARDPDLRAQLAAIDPSALFALLGELDDHVSTPPRPQVSTYAPRTFQRSTPWLRAGLAAAAALLALTVVIWQMRGADSVPQQAAHTLETRDVERPTIVERVDAPGAQIISLPGEDGGPTVTLIIDEGIEL